MPPFFIIRIPKKDQKDRREKIGNIYIPPSAVFMTRECQAGQIVAIGLDAAKIFPEAKIGNILLHHHFVSGKQAEGTDEGRYMIHEDEVFHYYTVTSISHNGRQNETYGIFNGKEIIAHPDFMFLEPEPEERNDLSPDEYISDSITKTKSGILVFKKWVESRKSKKERMGRLQLQVKELSKSTIQWTNQMPDHIKRAIDIIEDEMNKISKDLNQKRFEPHIVFAASKSLPISYGDVVYTLNIASHTEMEFMGKKFLMVKSKYVAMIEESLQATG